MAYPNLLEMESPELATQSLCDWWAEKEEKHIRMSLIGPFFCLEIYADLKLSKYTEHREFNSVFFLFFLRKIIRNKLFVSA